MKKNIGFEGGTVVPITRGNVKSSWPAMPCESNERTKRGYHCLNVGQANASWQHYLQRVVQDKRQRVHAALDVEIERRRARLQALLDNQ
jgi:hypothetical protein